MIDRSIESSAVRGSEYRRGAVLGLTVAEVFILLLFLLMLAFLVLAQDWQNRQEAVTTQLEQLQERVLPQVQSDQEGWLDAIAEFEAPDEIVTLKRDKVAAEAAAEKLRAEFEEAERGRNEAVKELLETERAREEAQRQVEQTREELRILREKGHNPPCWYHNVQDGLGGEREKPYYTFDVAVFDENMVVRQVEPPPGGAEDDNGSTYAAEAVRLRLDRIPYDTPLNDAATIRHLQPIHDAGKRAEVRSYSCIFWVRVWDLTSPDAKDRWKRAHDNILEGLFGAYTVRDDPWQEPR